MHYLNYISDEQLTTIVTNILQKGITRKSEAEVKFRANVIDPFSALFESAVLNISHASWKKSEIIRQCQKTLQNHIGELHQKILGSVSDSDWETLKSGHVIDLISRESKIIAEIKNKHNTVTGSHLSDIYHSLENLVMHKVSQYKGFTAYFVTVIPKKPIRFNEPFHPSNRETGKQCQTNEKIRRIDGASFYSLVTGEADAIANLYHALPIVIEDIFRCKYGENNFKIADKKEFANYFDVAYNK